VGAVRVDRGRAKQRRLPTVTGDIPPTSSLYDGPSFHSGTPAKPPGAVRRPSEYQLAVGAARDALLVLQWRLTAGERHSVLSVAHTLLDRMYRVDATIVPCPLRDLELDTGLLLPTISAALNRGLRDTVRAMLGSSCPWGVAGHWLGRG